VTEDSASGLEVSAVAVADIPATRISDDITVAAHAATSIDAFGPRATMALSVAFPAASPHVSLTLRAHQTIALIELLRSAAYVPMD